MPEGWEREVVGDDLGLSFGEDDDPPALVGWDVACEAAVVSAAVPVPVEVELRSVDSEPVVLLALPVPPVPVVVAESVRPVREVEEVWDREVEEEVTLSEPVVVVVVCAAARVARRAERRREEATFILGGRVGCFCFVCDFVG